MGLKTFLGKLGLGLGAGLTALTPAALTNCDTTLDQTQPDEPTGPTKPVIDGISTANNDLEFGEINTNWTQAEVNTRVRMAMNFLAGQAKDISDEYKAWRNEIAPQQNYFNAQLIRMQLSFADGIRNNEDTINYALSRSQPIDSAKDTSYQQIIGIQQGLTTMTDGHPTAISASVGAFRTASYIDSRKHASPEELAPHYDSLQQRAVLIQKYCYYSLPTNNIKETIRILKAKLPTVIPKGTGPPAERGVFIRQFEDYSQFDGWTDDLKALGYSLDNIPPLRSIQIVDNYKPKQDTRTREQIQKDNGMWW